MTRRLAVLTAVSACLLGDAGAYAQSALPVIPQPSGIVKTSSTQNVHLHFGVFIHGYHALSADADYVLQPWGYGVETHLYTVGLASWFLTLNLLSNAQGHFKGEEIAPVAFSNNGFSHGEEQKAHIDFDLSGPHVTTLVPPDKQREALPETELKQSIDMLSYIVFLTHRMSMKGDCTVRKPVFDGIHLSYLESHGPTQAIIPKDHGAYFKGDSLRCDFTGRQIGGFSIGSRFKAAQSTPHPGSVWFVQDPKAGMLPARIEFEHYKMGEILIVLQTEPKLSAVSHDQAH
nr:DUF3108 domain-containing protein [Bombella mellum]